ncbi:MAG: oxaloacetate decarboxylase [bacterium]|nr:oxaloacetate decarboxylase [bacterium]
MKKILMILSGLTGVVLLVISLLKKASQPSASMTIIGGSDGPTSVFLAGKTGLEMPVIGIIAGVLLLVLSGILAVRKK